MTKDKRKKISRARLWTAVSVGLVALLVLALVILNIFVPVKYLTAYLVPRARAEEGVLRVTFVDVGYGDCTICELPDGKVMLIDGGDGAYPNTLSVLTALNERNIDRIDYLVCSSVLGEYCGGLAEVLKYKEVGKVFMPAVKNTYITSSYASFIKALGGSDAERVISCYGGGVSGEGYFMTFLSPSSPDNPEGEYAELDSSAQEANILNVSAVMWLEYAGVAFALSSSAGRDVLKKVADNYKLLSSLGDKFAASGGNEVKLEECTFVTASGHGREECSSPDWYDALSADYAIISVGENYSDCPSAQAIADIGNTVSALMTTQTRGNITVTVTADGKYNISEERT